MRHETRINLLPGFQSSSLVRPSLLLSAYLVGNDDKVSDLWEHREGLRKAIKEILAGGNIPTRVMTLIYLAGLRAAAPRRISLLPQPHPCCSEAFTPIEARQCLSACLSNCQSASAEPRPGVLLMLSFSCLQRLAFSKKSSLGISCRMNLT